MAVTLVNVGTTANDGTGDPLRTAFQTVNTALTTLDPFVTNPLTAAELGELQNIGATTISAGQWGYLGALDQALATTDSPTFEGLGIGTAPTTDPLTVVGSIVSRETDNGFDAIKLLAGSSSGALQVFSGGTQTVAINGNNSDNYINTSGLFGIGTNLPTEKLDVNSDAIRIRSSQTPASAAATGTVGMICWDASYIYVCIATNTWKRAAIATW